MNNNYSKVCEEFSKFVELSGPGKYAFRGNLNSCDIRSKYNVTIIGYGCLRGVGPTSNRINIEESNSKHGKCVYNPTCS